MFTNRNKILVFLHDTNPITITPRPYCSVQHASFVKSGAYVLQHVHPLKKTMMYEYNVVCEACPTSKRAASYKS